MDCDSRENLPKTLGVQILESPIIESSSDPTLSAAVSFIVTFVVIPIKDAPPNANLLTCNLVILAPDICYLLLKDAFYFSI